MTAATATVTRLTAETLASLGACPDVIAHFSLDYPDGVPWPPTVEQIIGAVRRKYDTSWFVTHLAPLALQDEYQRQDGALWTDYQRRHEALRDDYRRWDEAFWFQVPVLELWDGYERNRAILLADTLRQCVLPPTTSGLVARAGEKP